ncbi:hypothetical protein FRB90_012119, partial [Tulasnella sp. 427]
MEDLRDDQTDKFKENWQKQINRFTTMIADERKRSGGANQQVIESLQTQIENLRKNIDNVNNGERDLTKLQS